MHFTASAPGRMDVMGGIADYSGALVLQKAISNRTQVQYYPGQDTVLQASSYIPGEPANLQTVDLNILLPYVLRADYEGLRSYIHHQQIESWILYVAGCFLLAHIEKKAPLVGGQIIIHSDVPLGKGVSSSASLEVAVLKALQLAHQINFQANQLPVMAQRVENWIVGAPCGLMDQLACYYGSQQAILPILCQPDLTKPPVSIPSQIHFVGIDSGERHAIQGASYSDVRAAAFMGMQIILHHLGHNATEVRAHIDANTRNKLPFGAYLANIDVQTWIEKYESLMPESITGKAYLEKYKEHIDPVTQILPEKTYYVKQAAAHPVFEQQRTTLFLQFLQQANLAPPVELEPLLQNMGSLMYEAHQSYTKCGLNSPGTDLLVNLAKEYKHRGIYGAKITGGGSGGTVCFLAYTDEGLRSVQEIHQKYQQSIGKSVIILD